MSEMSCKTCGRWAAGWCLAQQLITSRDGVCNAWELSRVVEWEDENEKLQSRIAELEAENETIISDYEERMDNLVNIGNETGRLLQAEIGYLNAQLGIKNLTTETLQLRIDQLIEVSEKMFTAVIAAADSYDEGMRVWDKIVNDWKEG